MRNFSILCVTNAQEIQSEIHDLAWKFQFITLAIIGICIIIATILGRLFIGPIDHLTIGMKAIARRDFSVSIPILAEDELGRLAGLFNETIDDFKDLDVARTIQETLFPAKPLVLKGWEIYGSCLPATKVGGDYFDYFSLDENRVLLIIGDVSGHGVGAALVVSMAKAVLGHPATTGTPVEILASLNTILFTILKRKKMMSCCLGILDQRTGILTLANAGQSYPILLKEGKPSFLELKGYPLGSTKNWKASTQAFGPLSLEIILFYTDGLIEAMDADDRPIGYDRFQEALPSLIRRTATGTEQAIRAWHGRLTRQGPPDDDISLLVLQGRQGE